MDFSSNPEAAASAVLRQAFADGIIYRQFPAVDKIDQRVFEIAAGRYKFQPFALKDPQFSAETQRYIEHAWPLAHLDTQSGAYLIELARINIPRGSVGFVRSIEQFIKDREGHFYPTGSEFWGVPYQGDTDLDRCKWYLRLVNFDGKEDARFYWSGPFLPIASALPGQAFWDLPEFENIWYPPHCAARFPTLLIPGGYSLRFYFGCSASTEWQWSVAGRLRASMQSIQCAEAVRNTRISTW